MKKKSKYKDLFKNVGLLTLSNFGSKILSFLFVPIYTAILSTNEYGIFDIFNTTISLLIPLLTLNIIEGALRFLLDKDSNKKEIVSLGIKKINLSIILVTLFIFVNNKLNIFDVINEYGIFFLLLYVSNTYYSFCSNVSRGFDKVGHLAIASFLNTFFTLFFNILFLVVFKNGLTGYFFAQILSHIIPTIYLFIVLKLWKYIKIFNFDEGYDKQIVNYSTPLLVNSISWWINNASDRYIIIWLLGLSYSGVYSVAYKIPTIINVVQTIFNQAWILSTVKEYDKNDEDGFFTNTYNAYNFLLVFVGSVIIITTKIIARLLYSNDFYLAWQYVPFLTISVVFGAISGYIGGLFIATKDSKIYSISTMIGAIFNIIFNFLLIMLFGVMGAAISTLLSYFVVYIIRIYFIKKKIKIRFELFRDNISYLILIIQSVILFILNGFVSYILEMILLLILLLMYKKEIKLFLKKIGGIR